MCLGILSRVEVSPNFSPLKNFPKASTQLTDYHLNRQALDMIRINAHRFTPQILYNSSLDPDLHNQLIASDILGSLL
jgi:hypothetical protein